MNQKSTKTAQIKFHWTTRHHQKWWRSNISEPVINKSGWDRISVNHSSTTVEIKFQWARHRLRQSRSNFSEPAITKVIEIKLSVIQPSSKTAEIKFPWSSHRLRQIKFQWTSHQPRLRSSFSEPAIDHDDRDQGWDQAKCEKAIGQDGQDQVSVSQSSNKTVEIKFQWTSHQAKWLISS